MSNCTHCGCNKLSCGCKDSYLTTPPAFPTPENCPAAQPCSETFDSQCIIYTGVDILCDLDTVVQQDDTVAEAIKNIIDYLCYRFNSLIEVNIVAGYGIEVTSNTVGTLQTFTITNTGLKKYTENFTSDFDGDIKVILGSDLANCNLLELDPCSKVILPGSACDLNINVYFKTPNTNTWNLMPFSETGSPSGLYAQIDDITGDITLVFNLASPISPVNVRVVIIG